MAVKSIYWPRPKFSDGVVEIDGDEHRHLRVSRIEDGEAVELFDGAGRVWRGEVIARDRHRTRVRCVDERVEAPPTVGIILALALIQHSRFERAIEQAVEIGVTRIVPFRAARSNEAGPARDTRWRKILIEAAKQSKHYHLPRLDPVTEFTDVIEIGARSKIVFAERGEGELDDALHGDPVLYLIGPEGGWTDAELEAVDRAGFRSVRLGTHILRAETAAVAGAALISHSLRTL